MITYRAARSIFRRQFNDNDCGPACLEMILRFAGNYSTPGNQRQRLSGEISLFDLRELANHYSLKSECVEMDMDTLLSVPYPCILHTLQIDGASHFIVWFGKKKTGRQIKFLIGDPAVSLMLIDQNELDRLWRTRTALYFPGLSFKSQYTAARWVTLLKQLKDFRAIWMVTAAISMAGLGTALAIVWCLQKLADTDAGSGIPVTWLYLFIMLLIARSLTTYLRQQLLTKLYIDTGSMLANKLLDRIATSSKGHILSSLQIKNLLGDIHKVQQANLALSSVLLPDLLSAIIIICISAWILPATIILHTSFLVFQLFISLDRSSANITELNAIGARSKMVETATVLANQAAINLPAEDLKEGIQHLRSAYYAPMSRYAHHAAWLTNYFAMTMDIPSLIYLPALFLLLAHDYHAGSLKVVEMIMILAGSIFITTASTRLLPAITQIEAGDEACQHLHNRL